MSVIRKIDWTSASATVAGALFVGAVYVAGLVILFGPMAHALTHYWD